MSRPWPRRAAFGFPTNPTMTEKTFSQHQADASRARHAKKTPAERSAYAKMMVEARKAKRKDRKAEAPCTCKHLMIGSCRADHQCACPRHS